MNDSFNQSPDNLESLFLDDSITRPQFEIEAEDLSAVNQISDQSNCVQLSLGFLASEQAATLEEELSECHSPDLLLSEETGNLSSLKPAERLNSSRDSLRSKLGRIALRLRFSAVKAASSEGEIKKPLRFKKIALSLGASCLALGIFSSHKIVAGKIDQDQSGLILADSFLPQASYFPSKLPPQLELEVSSSTAIPHEDDSAVDEALSQNVMPAPFFNSRPDLFPFKLAADAVDAKDLIWQYQPEFLTQDSIFSQAIEKNLLRIAPLLDLEEARLSAWRSIEERKIKQELVKSLKKEAVYTPTIQDEYVKVSIRELKKNTPPDLPDLEVIKGLKEMHVIKEELMTAAGIPEDQWSSANKLIYSESLWDYNIWNLQGGSAYGFCQRLMRLHKLKVGEEYMHNPVAQLKWCDDYAIRRYGSWDKAWKFWQKNRHW